MTTKNNSKINFLVLFQKMQVSRRKGCIFFQEEQHKRGSWIMEQGRRRMTTRVEHGQYFDIHKSVRSRRALKGIRERDSRYKFFAWDLLQNYTYITYLMNFRYIFDSQTERKRVKVFRHLSKLITSRNAHQIKSHHQKMMLRHGNVDSIIECVRQRVTKELETQPQLVPAFERVNRDSQAFFVRQFGLDRTSLNQRNNGVAGLGLAEGVGEVKLEEGEAQPVKVEAQPAPLALPPLLKEEEQEDLIWHRPN